MNSREFSQVVLGLVRPFRNEVLVPEIIPTFGRDLIRRQTVRRIVEAFALRLKKHVPEDKGETVAIRLESFIDAAMDWLVRNPQIHNADGTGVMNQDNADALLVSFAHHLCKPIKLGLHTRDLLPLPEGSLTESSP